MRKILFTILIASALTGITALAAEGFVPIAPISSSEGTLNEQTSLPDYINIVFSLALTAGAVLAVIMIAVGGFQYMLSQTLPGQKDGRARITAALYGLAILLLVYLILWVIGGHGAVSLNIFE